MSVGIATTTAFLLSLGFLVFRFNYLIKPIVDTSVLKQMFRFSLGNFIAEFTGVLPTMILPILITNSIGAVNGK